MSSNVRIRNGHYHVVDFINGYLNDYDSGPYATLKDARAELREVINDYLAYDAHVERAGKDRFYVDGRRIVKIERCTEKECFSEYNY